VGNAGAPRAAGEPAVVLFDGVCNLCSGTVRFLIPRDPRARLRFAALQSPAGQEIQRRFGLEPSALDTLVLVEGDRCYRKSSAALRVARHLSGAWPLLVVGLLLPRPLRDWAYDQLARRRYAWFGRREECLVPTPELRERFLS
jgi:predicted DCC family thiol-disulfide oxidoreductase YuxK